MSYLIIKIIFYISHSINCIVAPDSLATIIYHTGSTCHTLMLPDCDLTLALNVASQSDERNSWWPWLIHRIISMHGNGSMHYSVQRQFGLWCPCQDRIIIVSVHYSVSVSPCINPCGARDVRVETVSLPCPCIIPCSKLAFPGNTFSMEKLPV